MPPPQLTPPAGMQPAPAPTPTNPPTPPPPAPAGGLGTPPPGGSPAHPWFRPTTPGLAPPTLGSGVGSFTPPPITPTPTTPAPAGGPNGPTPPWQPPQPTTAQTIQDYQRRAETPEPQPQPHPYGRALSDTWNRRIGQIPQGMREGPAVSTPPGSPALITNPFSGSNPLSRFFSDGEGNVRVGDAATAASLGAGKVFQVGRAILGGGRAAAPAASGAAAARTAATAAPAQGTMLGATPTAPFVTGAEAAPAAARQSWLGWLGQKADTVAKYDPVTGVVGPIRNLASLGASGVRRDPGAAVGAAFRGGLTASAPQLWHTLDESINRPGTIESDRMGPGMDPSRVRTARRTADQTEAIREAPPLAEMLSGEQHLTRARRLGQAALNTIPGLGDPDAPGLGRYIGGNLRQTGDVVGESIRNIPGTVGRAARATVPLQEAVTGNSTTNPGMPAEGDTYRQLRQEYLDANAEYQQALRRGEDPTRALERFNTQTRGLGPMFDTVNYPSPQGAGIPMATRQFLYDQAADRLRQDPGFAQDPAALEDIGRLRQTADSAFLYPTGQQDERNVFAPFPTATDRATVARNFGQGPQPSGGLGGWWEAGRQGNVPQTAAAAQAASDRLPTQIAPIEANLRAGVQQNVAERQRLVQELAAQQPQQPQPTEAGLPTPPTVPGPLPQLGAGPTGGGEMPEIPQPGALDQAPPPVRQEIEQAGPQVAERVAELAGVPVDQLAAGGAAGAAAAVAAASQARPPESLREYWDQLPGASRVLAIAGLSLTAISFLRSAFSSGDEEDEPGFLMRVLPYLGLGAAAWGLGGGTLWGDNGVSMPQMQQYENLWSGIKGNLPLGPGS